MIHEMIYTNGIINDFVLAPSHHACQFFIVVVVVVASAALLNEHFMQSRLMKEMIINEFSEQYSFVMAQQWYSMRTKV